VVRAKFDSAQTNADNRRHWANADGLSADAAASPAVRQTLRNRARYEVANNSYARGIVLTLANDVTGTGPRLQMLTGSTGLTETDSAKTNQTIEREFMAWAKAVDLPGKLRTMRMARAQDGEAFAMLFSNDNLNSPVKLDLKLIEAEQVATPDFAFGSAVASPPRHGEAERSRVDGIEFDPFGNPVAYHILKSHPGGGARASFLDFQRVRADSCLRRVFVTQDGHRNVHIYGEDVFPRWAGRGEFVAQKPKP
jgi:capsid protein